MDVNYAVVWNVGELGNLLCRAIAVQTCNVNYHKIEKDNAHSHDISQGGLDRYIRLCQTADQVSQNLHKKIIGLHPYDKKVLDLLKQRKIIINFMEDPLYRYFGEYMHYKKFFGQFPSTDWIPPQYQTSWGNLLSQIVHYKWNVANKGPKTDVKHYRLDVLQLFTNFNIFLKQFEQFLGQKLKKQTIEIFENKKDKNRGFFEEYNKLIDYSRTSECYSLENLTHYEKALIICLKINNDRLKYDNFIKLNVLDLQTNKDLDKYF